MFRLLIDENFNNDIVRGLRLRMPELELLRVQDVGMEGAEDPDVLAWAALNACITLTHDKATFPDSANERVAIGEPMPGVIVVNDRMPVGQAINEIIIVITCSEPSEWANRILYLPI